MHTDAQVEDVPGLQLDGVRATRARYPNLPGGIEVSPGYGAMISSGDATWTPPDFNKYGKVDFYTDNISAHDRPNAGWFEHYMIGTNGLCSVYDPPVSYWCSEHPSGGGAFAFRTPSGVTPKKGALPNAPYKDASDALFFVWRPARWANWMFEIGKYDEATGNFTFGKGGNQGARGENSGGDFFIENVGASAPHTRSPPRPIPLPLPRPTPRPTPRSQTGGASQGRVPRESTVWRCMQRCTCSGACSGVRVAVRVAVHPLRHSPLSPR